MHHRFQSFRKKRWSVRMEMTSKCRCLVKYVNSREFFIDIVISYNVLSFTSGLGVFMAIYAQINRRL